MVGIDQIQLEQVRHQPSLPPARAGNGAHTQPDLVLRLTCALLTQDTAKSTHDPDTGLTLVDLNRAGAALIEIVTQPDMR